MTKKESSKAACNLLLVRHGESEANVGMRTVDFSNIALTEFGHVQAQAFAAACPQSQQVILSPYLRARQTAEPLLARFPGISTSVLPVFEFSYLDAVAMSGTTSHERKPRAMAFWERADPFYHDGGTAESFQDLINRVEGLLAAGSQLDGTTIVFTHMTFMQAVMHHIMCGRPTPSADSMRSFSGFSRSVPVGNCVLLPLRLDGGDWLQGGLVNSHLATLSRPVK